MWLVDSIHYLLTVILSLSVIEQKYTGWRRKKL